MVSVVARPRLVSSFSRPAHYYRWSALRNRGRYQEAAGYFREALKGQPDFAEAHEGLGLALKKLGSLEESIASYRRALELKPERAENHCNLGVFQIVSYARSPRSAAQCACRRASSSRSPLCSSFSSAKARVDSSKP